MKEQWFQRSMDSKIQGKLNVQYHKEIYYGIEKTDPLAIIIIIFYYYHCFGIIVKFYIIIFQTCNTYLKLLS